MEKIAKRHEKRNILKCDFYLFKISLKQTTALQGKIKVKLENIACAILCNLT